MPRTYVRTTQRQSWTAEQLKSALKAIKEGSSIRKAGKEFGIPESTLRDKLKIVDNGELAPALGRKPVFTPQQEKEISEHVLKLANLFYGYEKNSYPPHRIFNMDETGITTVQKKSAKIDAKKGQKRVGCATSVERGKTITVVCSMNAAGSYIPPMMIYPRKRMAAHLQIGGPIGATYQCSNNGWINEKLFVVWLQHFRDFVKPTETDPVLLICDNHGSHITLEAYAFCRENHITVVSIPPHTSHRLQPLDITFFGPLKEALSREYGFFMTQNAHRKITIADVASLLNKAYVKVASMRNAVSGFKSTGIMPYDPERFSDEDFAPAEEFQEPIVMDDSLSTQLPGDDAGSSLTGTHSVASPVASTSTNSPYVAFGEVAQIPKFINQNKKDTNKKLHSEILTSTPIKNKLEVNKRKKEENEQKKEDRKRNKEANPKKEPTASSSKEVKTLTRKLSFNMEDGNKGNKKKTKKNREPPSETDESDLAMDEMCDDELDDMDMIYSDKNNEKCIFCDEFGRDNEQWFRCVKCGFWAHSECSGWDSPEDYECDMCIKKGKKKKNVEKS